jgi:hypothetical protein
MTFYAISEAKLKNPFKLATSSTGLKCSFAGGCEYQVTGTAGI